MEELDVDFSFSEKEVASETGKPEAGCRSVDASTSYDDRSGEAITSHMNVLDRSFGKVEGLNETISKPNTVPTCDDINSNQNSQELEPCLLIMPAESEEKLCENSDKFDSLNKISQDCSDSIEVKNASSDSMNNRDETEQNESVQNEAANETNEKDNVSNESMEADENKSELENYNIKDNIESLGKNLENSETVPNSESPELEETDAPRPGEKTTNCDVTPPIEAGKDEVSPSNFNEEDAVDIAGSCDNTAGSLFSRQNDDGCLATIPEEESGEETEAFERNEASCGADEENSLLMTSANDVIVSNAVELNAHEKEIVERGGGDATNVAAKINCQLGGIEG